MKVRITVLAFIIITAYIPVLTSGKSSAGENSIPADIVPSSAALYGRGASYTRGIDIFLYFIHNVAAAQGRRKTIEWMNSFASATNIDLRNKNSLEMNGIDTARPFAVSYFQNPGKEGDFLFVIPVKQGTSFPYKFVDIIRRKTGAKKNIDMNPAITRYGKHSMFQIQKDIFFSSHEQYFLVSSSGSLLRSALDCAAKKSGAKSLAGDKEYREFWKGPVQDSDVSLYARNGMAVTDALSHFTEPSTINIDDENVQSEPPPGNPVPFFESTGMGISKNGNRFQCEIIAKLNHDNPSSDILRESIRANSSQKCIYANNALLYSYLSLKPESLHRFCEDNRGKNTTLCSAFYEITELMIKYTNLIIEKDFVNSFEGISNIAVKKSGLQGHPDHYVMYFTMKDRQAGKAFWNTMKDYLQDSEDIGYTFNEKKIGVTPAFSVKNMQGAETIYANNDNSFFISNNAEFLSSMINEKKLSLPEICSAASGNKIDSTVFSFTRINLEDESFIKAIILLSTYNSNRLLYNILNKSLKMEMVGKINMSTIMFNLDIHIRDTSTRTPK